MTIGWRPRDRVVTPAASVADVVTLSAMKEHLRVYHDDEDLLISDYTRSALEAVEAYTQRFLSPRQVVLQLPSLPSGRCPVELPGGVVSAVSSVVVNDVSISGCVAFGHSPALLVPPSDWPVVELGGYPVTITYTAGYSVPPMDLIQAVKLLCGSMYENHENASTTSLSSVPVSAEYLMGKHRIAPV